MMRVVMKRVFCHSQCHCPDWRIKSTHGCFDWVTWFFTEFWFHQNTLVTFEWMTHEQVFMPPCWDTSEAFVLLAALYPLMWLTLITTIQPRNRIFHCPNTRLWYLVSKVTKVPHGTCCKQSDGINLPLAPQDLGLSMHLKYYLRF